MLVINFLCLILTKDNYIWENLESIWKTNTQYFKRDISWLSFNYRVLLEADGRDVCRYTNASTLSPSTLPTWKNFTKSV
ncbi:MAG: hypothetical protein ACLUVY_03970 [Bacteroides uniformis]